MPPFVFAAPSRTLVAEDEGEAIDGRLGEHETWLPALERRLHGDGAGRFVVGAVPFGDDQPVRLFCPTRVTIRERRAEDRVPEPVVTDRGHEAAPRDDAVFRSAVERAVDAIDRGRFDKVVLARVRDLELPTTPNVERILASLRARHPHGFTYALRLPGDDDVPRTLVGASPELLLSRRGPRVVSVPLAGSIARASDPEDDRRRADRLLRSEKDRHEHRLVVDHVVATLRPFARALHVDEPVVVPTSSMWHLSTRIEGELADRGPSSLRLALSLHPTPAICGTPTAVARAFIAEAEPFERGYFTGALGYMDARGDGEWVVTIRCAELVGAHARVFAGAGIVAGSRPELELAETHAKMLTMLNALA